MGAEDRAAHAQAVERVVEIMRERMHEPLALGALAAAAHLSPFHFSRVFRSHTGSPPGEFLGALRLDAAKRLLLTTSMSVTEICFEVGYASLGSFSARFGRLVGLAPADLRRLAGSPSPARVAAAAAARRPAAGSVVSGEVGGAPAAGRLICVGLFERPIPFGQPAACTLLLGHGRYRVGPVPDGVYYPMAASMPVADDPLRYLLADDGLLVALAPGPVLVRRGAVSGATSLQLRAPRPTDPPVVAALPLLQARYALGRLP